MDDLFGDMFDLENDGEIDDNEKAAGHSAALNSLYFLYFLKYYDFLNAFHFYVQEVIFICHIY